MAAWGRPASFKLRPAARHGMRLRCPQRLACDRGEGEPGQVSQRLPHLIFIELPGLAFVERRGDLLRGS
jgi:hypothetical protein